MVQLFYKLSVWVALWSSEALEGTTTSPWLYENLYLVFHPDHQWHARTGSQQWHHCFCSGCLCLWPDQVRIKREDNAHQQIPTAHCPHLCKTHHHLWRGLGAHLKELGSEEQTLDLAAFLGKHDFLGMETTGLGKLFNFFKHLFLQNQKQKSGQIPSNNQ